MTPQSEFRSGKCILRPKMPLNHRRPIGITLLALLIFFIGFCHTVFNPIIGLPSDADIWQQSIARVIHSANLLKVTSYWLPPFLYLLYAAYMVIGFGLWRLQNWARISVFVLIIVGCVLGPLIEPFSGRHWSYELLRIAVWVLPYAWLVFYLNRPRIRFAFRNGSQTDGNELKTDPPSGLSRIGKIWVAAALAASMIMFVCDVMIQ